MAQNLDFFQSRSGSQGDIQDVFFGPASKAFKRAQAFGDKQKAQQVAEQRQQDTTDIFNELAEEPPDAREEELFNILTQLQGPAFVNQVQKNADRADKKELEAATVLMDDMFKISTNLLEEKNPAKQLTDLRGIIAERQRKGLPTNRLASALGKTLDARNAIFRQMQKTTEKTSEFFKGRKAKLESRLRREEEAAKPKTNIGKAQSDFKRGLISKSQLDQITNAAKGKLTTIDPGDLVDGELIQQMSDGTIRRTRVLTPEQVKEFGNSDKKATGETQIMADGTVVFANKDGTVSVVDQSGENIPAGSKRTEVLKAALKAKGDLARIQSGQVEAGKQSIKASEKAFEKVAVIRQNVLNLDRAIAAVDEGAKSGVIASRFPSIRSSSIKLDQIQRELGLDVIGFTTFGALSKGELDLALEVAIPKKLNPEELRKWLVEKKSAQEKLMGYIERSALYLGEPGHTLKGWREKQISDQEAIDNVNPPPGGVGPGTFIYNPKTGKIEKE